MPLIECRHLKKNYGANAVLRGVNLSIEAGETVALLGCNGAGKSTLLRLILGLLRADSGHILLWGEPPSATTRQRIGYLPEDCGLYDRMRVDETINFFGGIHGLSPAEIRRRSAPLIDVMGLADRVRSRIQTLSKGNQQKVKLICALMHQPELLIFDEPFSGLDVEGTRILSQALRTCSQQGITLVLSSHRLDQMEQLASRALVLHGGEIRLDRSITEACRPHAANLWEVELSEEMPQIEALLQSLPGVEKFTASGARFCLQLRPEFNPCQVLKELIRRDVPVHSFNPQRLTLEQAYVEATEGAILRGGDA